MTRLVRFSNNAVSQLAANLTLSGTSLSVTPGDGAKFPSLSAGQYFMATLVKADGSTEVVKVTARSTDTMTIVRAAEPVAGASTSYAFSAGDRIEARLTAGVLGNEIDRLDAAAIIGTLNKNANYTVQEADVTSLIRVDTSGGVRTITLPQISTLTADFDIIIDKVTSDVNAVTIARQGSDTINGGTLYTLTAQYQSAWVVADRSTNTWSVIQSNSNGVGVNAIVDEGTGSGSATITLSVDPGSINNVDVIVGGVPQLTSTMSLSGTTLTVGGAIAAGVKWMAKYCVPLSIGTPSDGSVTTAKIADANVTTAKLADNAITYAKMQSVTAGKVLGRDTSGAGTVQELPIAVTSTGKVGIGLTPTMDFQVSGLIRVNQQSNSRYRSDFYVNTGVATINAYDDTGSVYIPFQASANNFSLLVGNAGNVAGMSIDSSANFKMNSGYGSVATSYGCRAWVNFDGTGASAANQTIRASGNVSSVYKNGNSDYSVNYASAMPDANYAGAGSGQADTGNNDDNRITVSARRITGAYATTSTRIVADFSTSTATTSPIVVNWAIFR